MTAEEAVRSGIERTLEVFREPGFVAWARGWLSGTDTSQAAASAAAQRIEAASWPGEGEWAEGQAASALAEESWAEPSQLLAPAARAGVYAAKAAAALAAERVDVAETFTASAVRLAAAAAVRLPSALRRTEPSASA